MADDNAPWDAIEPSGDESFSSCYSPELKADLLAGTFVIVRAGTTTSSMGSNFCDTTDTESKDVVGRIVGGTGLREGQEAAANVNIFRGIRDILESEEGLLCPEEISVNHLWHMTEIVQTMDTCVVPT
ncbi:hypothetical protein MHU86_17173 [Fragilaria crotonensis]|nr:hypothetical protein MHU86_17173 [Fragilaria crotonensis]